MKKRIAIKDIAAALNISVTTVSFVLNGKAEEMQISKELTQRVIDYVRKVNYIPNQIAQSLRTGKSKILVFMVENIANLFFAELARMIEDRAYKKGYKVIFCSNDNDDQKSIELIKLFKERQVDGFIIVPSPSIQKTIQHLVEEQIPVVLLDRYYPSLSCNYVVTNNKEAVKNAIDHLKENGYKNIGFVTLETNQTQMKDRLDGYLEQIKNNNLTSYVLKFPFPEVVDNEGLDSLKAFFNKHSSIDAVVFGTYYLAERGLKAFKIYFPEYVHKLGFLTFDDHTLFESYIPAVTSIAQPLQQIAEEAMRIMWRLLDNEGSNDAYDRVVLESSLIIRESSLKRH